MDAMPKIARAAETRKIHFQARRGCFGAGRARGIFPREDEERLMALRGRRTGRGPLFRVFVRSRRKGARARREGRDCGFLRRRRQASRASRRTLRRWSMREGKVRENPGRSLFELSSGKFSLRQAFLVSRIVARQGGGFKESE